MTTTSARVLTSFLVVYILSVVFAYERITAVAPTLRLLFVIAPLVFLLWQLLVIREQLRSPRTEPDVRFYERIKAADWWRMFFVLWIGQRPLATDFHWGFLLFSGLVVVLVIVIVYTASVEVYRKRVATPLLVGCLLFGYFLLRWEKNLYAIHYGVPIIGHFLEKPEYDAQYRVEIESDASGRTFHAIADIHVENDTEEEDWGETDYYDRPIIETVNYREIMVRRLYLPSGLSVTIRFQDESLRLGETVFVEDSRGQDWYVRLLNEPIR